jgi:hypothetical protein
MKQTVTKINTNTTWEVFISTLKKADAVIVITGDVTLTLVPVEIAPTHVTFRDGSSEVFKCTKKELKNLTMIRHPERAHKGGYSGGINKQEIQFFPLQIFDVFNL